MERERLLDGEPNPNARPSHAASQCTTRRVMWIAVTSVLVIVAVDALWSRVETRIATRAAAAAAAATERSNAADRAVLAQLVPMDELPTSTLPPHAATNSDATASTVPLTEHMRDFRDSFRQCQAPHPSFAAAAGVTGGGGFDAACGLLAYRNTIQVPAMREWIARLSLADRVRWNSDASTFADSYAASVRQSMLARDSDFDMSELPPRSTAPPPDTRSQYEKPAQPPPPPPVLRASCPPVPPPALAPAAARAPPAPASSAQHMFCGRGGSTPTPPAPPSASRWLYFQLAEVSGGHADRMKGIMMAFALALVTGRAFGIDYARPTPLTDALVPNGIPWANFIPADALDGLPIYDAIGVVPDLAHIVNREARVIVLRENMNFLTLINQAYQTEWKRWGLPVAANLDVLFGCFFGALFRPTDSVRELLRATNLPLRPPYPHPSQLQPAASDAASTPRPHVICAQVRIGGQQPTFNEETAPLNKVDRLGPVWDELTAYAQSQWKINISAGEAAPESTTAFPGVIVFVTSDSDTVKELARARFGSNVQLAIIDGETFHLDKLSSVSGVSEDRFVAALRKVVADNYALGLCEFAVITHSGFGRTGVWRTHIPYDSVKVFVGDLLVPLRHRPYENVPYLALPPSSCHRTRSDFGCAVYRVRRRPPSRQFNADSGTANAGSH